MPVIKTGSHSESKRSSLLKTGLDQVHLQMMPVPTPALEGGKVHLKAAGSLYYYYHAGGRECLEPDRPRVECQLYL